MLEEKYPSESWVRVYTDGSATNERRGQYEEQQSEAIPTGKPLGQMDRNLVGSILERPSIKIAHLVPLC
jgi:hypothetical protein